MANTFELISAVTLGAGGASSVSFTSIPSTYTDLVLKLSTRQSGSSVGNQLAITFNGSSSGYSRTLIYGIGTGAYSAGGSSEAYARIAFSESSTYTANTFNNFEIYIPNYAGSNNKLMVSDAVSESNASSVEALAIYAARWSNSSAITSISISEPTGSGTSFVQYSSAYLYGIKSS